MHNKVKIPVLANLILLSAFITMIPTGVFSTASVVDPPSCGIVQESGHIIGTFPSVEIDQKSDSYGNTVLMQTCGFALDPVAAGNPPNNYYLMDILVHATAGKNWYVDTSGLGDGNGPTLVVTSLLMCSNCTVSQTQIWPKSTTNFPGGVPTTATVGVSYGGVSAGISWTWTPPSSQSQLVNETQTAVQWAAGDNDGGQGISTFAWTFQEVVVVPNTETARFYIVAKGNFFLGGNCGFAPCGGAHPFVISQHDYSTSPTISPTTTVTSSTSTIPSTLSTTTQTVTATPTSQSSSSSSGARTSPTQTTIVQQVAPNSSNGVTLQTLEIIVLAGVVSAVVGAAMIEIAKVHPAAAVAIALVTLIIAYLLISQVIA